MNKPIYHYDIEQGTEQWHALRCGVLTASEVKKIMTPACKPANNDKSRAHVWEIASQRVTKYTEPSYVSDDMLRGHSDEILARDLYSEKYNPATECGFITREIDGVKFGYSPDGLVGENGLIEIKSRAQKFQIENIVNGGVPTEHILQCQAGLLITGREWLEYISYCGGLPMYVCRVYPDPVMHDAIMEAAQNFDGHVRTAITTYEMACMALHPTERIERDIDIII